MNTYRSKAWAIALISLYVTWKLTQASHPPLWFIMTLTLFAGVVLPLWILRGTAYSLGEEQLDVACGPFRWKIPFSEIQSVTLASSRTYCPALSQEQVHIRYADDRVLIISPLDRKQFLQDLKGHCPQLAA